MPSDTEQAEALLLDEPRDSTAEYDPKKVAAVVMRVRYAIEQLITVDLKVSVFKSMPFTNYRLAKSLRQIPK